MATEFILREAAKAVVCDACEKPSCPELWGKDCSLMVLLNNIPTADVVEVVRCKDCRYFTGKSCMINEGMRESPIDGNGFCFYGERRTDNEN